jgi:putative ABC transport system permease protein
VNLSTVVRDIKLMVRSLARQRGLATAAILTIALGIGATSAMFSVVRAVLLAPLPYAHPDRIVTIWNRWQDFDKTWLSDQEVLDYQARSRLMAVVAAWDSTRVNLEAAGTVVRIGAARVTASTFEVFGTSPILGRTFTSDEDRPNQLPVAVLSYGLWQRQFGGAADVVGRPISIDGKDARVVGVMPAGFQLPTDYGEDAAEPTQLWIPLAIDPAHTERGDHGFYGAALLRPGVTPAQATDELRAITAAFTKDGLYPEAIHFTAFAVPVSDEILGGVRTAFILLSAAVIVLLLIASTNVAALLVARTEVRQREFAVRTALGANRWRLAQQQIAEGLVLALAGGAIGTLLALATGRVLEALGPTAIPRAADVTVDWRVVLFTLGAAVVTAVLFSLPPALRASRIDLVDGLKDGSTQATTSRGRLRTRGVMVTAQLAFALLLLIGAGLLLRSLWALERVHLGFNPDRVLTARVDVPADPYNTPEKILGYYDRLLARVQALPGVQHAGLIRSLPLGATIGDSGLDVDGYVAAPGQHAVGDWQVATAGALEAMGEHLVRGRLFTPADRADTAPVGLINETMARAYWPGQDAIGKRFRQGVGNTTRPWTTVVGIIGDVRHNGVTAPIREMFYRPYAQFYRSTGFTPSGGTIVVRTAGDPMVLAPALRRVAQEVDARVPVAAVRSMDAVVETAITTPRLTASVLGSVAVIALLLATVGIYGLLSYVVAQRTHEIGIRVAIGAEAHHVLRLVLGQGARLIGSGLAAGVLLALLATRALASLLYGVTPLDWATFTAVPGLLAVVAFAAMAVPAWRATRLDPIRALRRD